MFKLLLIISVVFSLIILYILLLINFYYCIEIFPFICLLDKYSILRMEFSPEEFSIFLLIPYFLIIIFYEKIKKLILFLHI